MAWAGVAICGMAAHAPASPPDAMAAPSDNGMMARGAVAVMPLEPLSYVFFAATPEDQADYELTIADAIAQDGRLLCIERARLLGLLREHTLTLAATDLPNQAALVAADVFVLPYVTSHDDRGWLHIVALHAPTASVLSELELPINIAAPQQFAPPLKQQVAQWWPGVLRALDAARNQPRWHVMEPDAQDLSQMPLTDAMYRHLLATVQSHRDAYLMNGPVLTATQREVVMQLMGLSHQQAGGFASMFDYVVDGKLASNGAWTIRVRDAKLRLLNQLTISAAKSDDLMMRVDHWLNDQIALHQERLKNDSESSQVQRRTAQLQSRLLFLAAMELKDEYEEFEDQTRIMIPVDGASALALPYSRAKERQRRYGIGYWRYYGAARSLAPQSDVPPAERAEAVDPVYRQLVGEFPQGIPPKQSLDETQIRELVDDWMGRAVWYRVRYAEQTKLVEQYRREGRSLGGSYRGEEPAQRHDMDMVMARYWRNVERAAQLDPTWEPPARLLASMVSEVDFAGGSAWNLMAYKHRMDAAQRYLECFPQSRNHEIILYDYARFSLRVGDDFVKHWSQVPATLDRDAIRRGMMRQGLTAYFDFCGQYVLADNVCGPYMPGDARFQHYGHFLYWMDRYVRLVSPPENEREEWVRRWADRFDRFPDQAPGSDFVRLLFFAERGQQRPYLALLGELMTRFPNPKTLPWTHVYEGGSQQEVASASVRESLDHLFSGEGYAQVFNQWVLGQVSLEVVRKKLSLPEKSKVSGSGKGDGERKRGRGSF